MFPLFVLQIDGSFLDESSWWLGLVRCQRFWGIKLWKLLKGGAAVYIRTNWFKSRQNHEWSLLSFTTIVTHQEEARTKIRLLQDIRKTAQRWKGRGFRFKDGNWLTWQIQPHWSIIWMKIRKICFEVSLKSPASIDFNRFQYISLKSPASIDYWNRLFCIIRYNNCGFLFDIFVFRWNST